MKTQSHLQGKSTDHVIVEHFVNALRSSAIQLFEFRCIPLQGQQLQVPHSCVADVLGLKVCFRTCPV